MPNPGVVEYYTSIKNQLSSGFEDDEQKEIFLNNVFEQLIRDIKEVIFHKKISFTVQSLLRLANEQQLDDVMKILLKDFETLVVHESACFVVRTGIYRCSHFLTAEEDNVSLRHILHAGMMLLDRAELINNKYCCFIVRSLLEVMSGKKLVLPSGRNKPSDSPDELKLHDFHEHFTSLLLALTPSLLPSSAALFGILKVPNSAATAQCVLTMLHDRFPSICKDKCKEMLDSGLFSQLNDDNIPLIFMDKYSSHFCETLFQVMPKVPMGRLLKHYVLPHFDTLVVEFHSYHVVQAAILHVKSDVQLEKVMKVMAGNLFKYIKNGKGFLVAKLLQAAVNFPEKQEDVLSLLQEELGTNANLLISLAVGDTSHNLSDDEVLQKLTYMPYASVMIVKSLLDLNNTSIISSSISSLSSDQFISLAFSKCGSRIFDTYMQSANVKLATKKSCASKLNPDSCLLLATHISGSCVFDKLWAHLKVPEKRAVAETLSRDYRQLSASKPGRIVGYNIKLTSYMHSRADWDEWILSENKMKKRKLAADVSEPEAKAKKSKTTGSEVKNRGELPTGIYNNVVVDVPRKKKKKGKVE